MATITETSPLMTDAPVRSGVQICFTVIDHDDPRAVAVADSNGRGTPNLRDRVFVTTLFQVARSDGRSDYRETTPRHVDNTNYTGLAVGTLLVALKTVHDVDRAIAGLS